MDIKEKEKKKIIVFCIIVLFLLFSFIIIKEIWNNNKEIEVLTPEEVENKILDSVITFKKEINIASLEEKKTFQFKTCKLENYYINYEFDNNGHYRKYIESCIGNFLVNEGEYEKKEQEYILKYEDLGEEILEIKGNNIIVYADEEYFLDREKVIKAKINTKDIEVSVNVSDIHSYHLLLENMSVSNKIIYRFKDFNNYYIEEINPSIKIYNSKKEVVYEKSEKAFSLEVSKLDKNIVIKESFDKKGPFSENIRIFDSKFNKIYDLKEVVENYKELKLDKNRIYTIRDKNRFIIKIATDKISECDLKEDEYSYYQFEVKYRNGKMSDLEFIKGVKEDCNDLVKSEEELYNGI